MTNFIQLVVVGLSSGFAYALVGIGMVLIHRTTGIVNFAQGAFAVMGGLVTATLVDDVPTFLAVVLAVLLVAVVGGGMGFIAFGRRGRTTLLASLIITLGLALLTSAVHLLVFTDVPRTYPRISDTSWNVGGVTVDPQYVLIGTVALTSALLLTFVLRHTIVGNALVACSDSRRAAELVGLSVRSLAVLSFAVSAALGGLAGALIIPLIPLTYDSDVSIAVNGFAAAAFGGLDSIRGALAGGLVLGIAENLVIGYIDPQYQLAIGLVIMLMIITWRSRHEVAT